MKFEELPERVQDCAAETLSHVIKTYWNNDLESYTQAADCVRAAFIVLFDGPNEVGRENDVASLLRFLADNPRIIVDDALGIFLSRDKQLEKVATVISDFAQKHGAEAP